MNFKIFGTAILLQLVFTLHMPTIACSGQPEESQLKAVFVLNFAKLTEWPADNLAGGSAFSIVILGKVPSAAFFNLLKGQTVRGGKVSVRRIEEVGEAKGSHLIFISESERYRLTGILRELSQQDILTVSDIAGFCEAGGMIGLMPVQNRLGFEVNLASVRKTRLTVGSQLLKLAKTIIGN